MKKLILVLIFIISSFASNIKAEAPMTGDGGIEWDTGSTYGTTGYTYATESFTLKVTGGGASYYLTFAKDVVFSTDKVKITRDLIIGALQSQCGVSNGTQTLDDIIAANGHIIAIAKIAIGYKDPSDTSSSSPSLVSTISSSNQSSFITSKDQISEMKDEHPTWFGGVAISEMKQRFNQGNLIGQVKKEIAAVKSGTDDMQFAASLQLFKETDIQNHSGNLININNFLGSSSNALQIKSGYGIPVTAELQKFLYAPIIAHCPCGNTKKSTYDDFTIEDSKTIITSTFVYDDFWKEMTGIDRMWTKEIWPVEKESARFALIFNTKYPTGSRKLYTNPRELDGNYKIIATATTAVTYNETTWKAHPSWWTNDDGEECHSCGWSSTTKKIERINNPFVNTVDLNVKITGAMFDDDGQSILNK